MQTPTQTMPEPRGKLTVWDPEELRSNRFSKTLTKPLKRNINAIKNIKKHVFHYIKTLQKKTYKKRK